MSLLGHDWKLVPMPRVRCAIPETGHVVMLRADPAAKWWTWVCACGDYSGEGNAELRVRAAARRHAETGR